ncbi:MAG TPA: rhodanese-like domain-containing protein [bacterium]|nr:rhodanese-like domain-containing protein [bacterium]
MVKIKTITIEKLLEMKHNNEDFKLVEVLNNKAYNHGHIPGAINIPAGELSERAPEELDKDETIVVYCSSYSCTASPSAAKKLTSMGYKNVYDFSAGKLGWEDAGLELEE